jgi:hypothetical protein
VGKLFFETGEYYDIDEKMNIYFNIVYTDDVSNLPR